jgi:hypothetical protein
VTRSWFALLLLAASACHRKAEAPNNATAGAALEQAAERTGLIIDSAKVDLVGAWARDTDRVCVVRTSDTSYRVGALIDYGAGQECAARGTATRTGDTVDVRFGACRFRARLDGDRLAFPASLPAECDSLCSGRASLAALDVDHLSTSQSEASTLRAPDRTPLCAS